MRHLAHVPEDPLPLRGQLHTSQVFLEFNSVIPERAFRVIWAVMQPRRLRLLNRF
jgi:hypothetical protein